MLASAGACAKHGWARSRGGSLCASSRQGSAFVAGAARLLQCSRNHLVLNSLSADFIPASLALCGEASSFAEIGKRSVWSSERHGASYHRHGASAVGSAYRAVALDIDIAHDALRTQAAGRRW